MHNFLFPVPGLAAALAAAGANPITPNTLAAPAAAITVAIPDQSRVYDLAWGVLSAANSNRVFVTFNGGTAETGNNIVVFYSNGSTANNSAASNNSLLLQNSLSTGGWAGGTLRVWRHYDGTNTRFFAAFSGLISSNLAEGVVSRSESGDVALTSVSICSNQTNGLAATSFLKGAE